MLWRELLERVVLGKLMEKDIQKDIYRVDGS